MNLHSAEAALKRDLNSVGVSTLGTTSVRVRTDISFQKIVYDGFLYLAIASSPWKLLCEVHFSELETNLDSLGSLSEDQVRESDAPLRSKLLSLAAKRGAYWMKFDERMDILCRDALKRVQEFIDSQQLPRRGKVMRVFEEDFHRHHGITYVAGGGGGGSGGYNSASIGQGGNGGGSCVAHSLVFKPPSWSPSENTQNESRLIRHRT